ncbi:unnamed protein product [marine sediment metagenome]|uniref:Uncharacterized protein n=1 Tax=marine sediment metagenome TaxID=412755 RepID=X1E7S6_9ZZZZ
MVLTSTDNEHLIKIMEYLTTVNKQFKDLVTPKLQKYGINSSNLEISIEKVQEEINQMLRKIDESRNVLDESGKTDLEPEEKKPDWTSINWGKRKH